MFRQKAREICSKHLENIGVDIPERMMEEFPAFKVMFSAYPYPAWINSMADTLFEQKQMGKKSIALLSSHSCSQEERRKMLSTALANFKNKINTDSRLKAIQCAHIELAKQTRYLLEGKNIALRDIKIGGWGVYAVIVAGILTAKFFPNIITVIVCMTMGIVTCFILGRGLGEMYNYVPIKQGAKESVYQKFGDSSTSDQEPSNGDMSIFIEPEISPDAPLLVERPSLPKENQSFTQNLMQHGLFKREKIVPELGPQVCIEFNL